VVKTVNRDTPQFNVNTCPTCPLIKFFDTIQFYFLIPCHNKVSLFSAPSKMVQFKKLTRQTIRTSIQSNQAGTVVKVILANKGKEIKNI
jgi:hypothetical protein